MEFRPAKASDFEEFGPNVPCSCRAWAAEDDGVIYGVGGICYMLGRIMAFTHMRPDMPKRDMIRGGRIVMEIVKKTDGPVFAYPGNSNTAPRTLKHFGFEQIKDSGWYFWRAS